MPTTGPAPRTHRQQPRPQVHRHDPMQPTPSRRPPQPKASPRPMPDAPQPTPGHRWTTRQRHHAQKPGHNPHRRSHTKGHGAHAPRPIFCTNSPPFLHPPPVATGASPRHQTHKKARSARSAIPRQITSARSAPVTAPFLRLLRHSPSLSAKPVSTVFPSSKYRFAMSSALISCSPPFCGVITTS